MSRSAGAPATQKHTRTNASEKKREERGSNRVESDMVYLETSTPPTPSPPHTHNVPPSPLLAHRLGLPLLLLERGSNGPRHVLVVVGGRCRAAAAGAGPVQRCSQRLRQHGIVGCVRLLPRQTLAVSITGEKGEMGGEESGVSGGGGVSHGRRQSQNKSTINIRVQGAAGGVERVGLAGGRCMGSVCGRLAERGGGGGGRGGGGGVRGAAGGGGAGSR